MTSYPAPWTIVTIPQPRFGSEYYVIRDAKGRDIIAIGDTEAWKDVVLAVNSHEALVKALNLVYRVIVLSNGRKVDWEDVCETIRAALAAATKES